MPATYVPGPNGPIVVASGSPASAAYTNFIARTSGLDAAHQAAYQALFDGLTTDGFFNASGNSLLLDALYVFATADTATALQNLCQNLYNATRVNTATFTADSGFTGNGSNMSIDSNFNPTTATTPLFVRDSACLFGWSNKSASDVQAMCGDTLAENAVIYPNQSGTGFMNINDGAFTSFTNADGSGLYTIVRTAASGAGAKVGYKNAGQVLSTTTASAALINAKIFFLHAGGYWSGQCMAGGFGAQLSSTNVSNLYARLHTYLQTIAGIA